MLALTERVAGILDEEYDIEIVESHHRFKADAPSGTALRLAEKAAAMRRSEETARIFLRGGERPYRRFKKCQHQGRSDFPWRVSGFVESGGRLRSDSVAGFNRI